MSRAVLALGQSLPIIFRSWGQAKAAEESFGGFPTPSGLIVAYLIGPDGNFHRVLASIWHFQGHEGAVANQAGTVEDKVIHRKTAGASGG